MRYVALMFGAAIMLIVTTPTSAQRGGSSGPFADFHKQAELAIGKPAPAMHLQDSEGDERDLRDYLGRYVFIEFGSYT